MWDTDSCGFTQPVVSRIFLYSFVILFIYAVLNIFIAIIQDAFAVSAYRVARKTKAARAAQLQQQGGDDDGGNDPQQGTGGSGSSGAAADPADSDSENDSSGGGGHGSTEMRDISERPVMHPQRMAARPLSEMVEHGDDPAPAPRAKPRVRITSPKSAAKEVAAPVDDDDERLAASGVGGAALLDSDHGDDSDSEQLTPEQQRAVAALSAQLRRRIVRKLQREVDATLAEFVRRELRVPESATARHARRVHRTLDRISEAAAAADASGDEASDVEALFDAPEGVRHHQHMLQAVHHGQPVDVGGGWEVDAVATTVRPVASGYVPPPVPPTQ